MQVRYLTKTNAHKHKGETCILRADFNIQPKYKEGSLRINSTIPTLKTLRKENIKVVIISHRGRPTPGQKLSSEHSLKPFQKILERKLNEPVQFISHYNVPRIKEQIENSDKSIFLLENIRTLPEETKNDKGLASQLATLGDFYVNDAFANAHRNHTSMVALANQLPAYAGIQLEKEIKNLTHVMKKCQKPLTLIVGGAKTDTKIGVIKYFKKKANAILLGGGPANTFLKAKGVDVGSSKYDPKTNVKPFLTCKNIYLPEDWVKARNMILDIGPKAIETFGNIIKKSKTIIWNGPMGLIEEKRFAQGSIEIAKIIGKKKNTAFTLAGGGETTGLIVQLGIENTFDLISTGGGAMLEFLSGKKLPAIEALRSSPS
jgi:phosphoglycerate kinase